MKFWALNLPQFYETPENNKWWGKGYTEWTSVKKAKPLFKGHKQPLLPLDEFYYDLSKKENIDWQAKLAKKYGVECFVYYHYWYEGRHLLEKPCEILLKSPEIDINYCFCWANHSWTRAWDGKNHEILVKQTYGDEQEWEKHFQYLKPFFEDKRYARIENCPVLFIYKANDITNGDERIGYWNRRIKEEGIAESLYIVEYISTFNPRPALASSKAVYEDEPNYSCRFEINILEKFKRVFCKKMKITDYQDYDRLWNLILKKKATYDGRKIILGGFPAWDNSPRKGKNSRVIRNTSPEKFYKYLIKIGKLKRDDSLDILLLNAWNEWGEGAILEPTEEYGYDYLKAVLKAKEGLRDEQEN